MSIEKERLALIETYIGPSNDATTFNNVVAEAVVGDNAHLRRHTVDRGRVELEVPRVHDQALRGVENDRRRLRHAVGNRNEGESERTLVDPFAGSDLVHIWLDALVLDARPRQLGRERTAVHGNIDLTQQVGQRQNLSDGISTVGIHQIVGRAVIGLIDGSAV